MSEGGDAGREARRRADAERNRAAILAAALERLLHDTGISMQGLAEAAGVSRSTLYRHFPTRSDLDRALRDEMVAAVRRTVEAAAEKRPTLAVLRRLAGALVEIGAQHRPDLTGALPLGSPGGELEKAATPLVEELAVAAALSPELPQPWARCAAGHFLELSLRLGAERPSEPGAVAEELFRSLTEPLDRGIVVLDERGSLLAINPPAALAMSPSGPVEAGEQLTEPRVEAAYEDGSPSPAGSYPLATAVRMRESQPPTVRGHRQAGGEVTWHAVEARVLHRLGGTSPYGLLGIITDITLERERELEQLRPAGELGRAQPVDLDVVRILNEIPPHLFPEQLVGEARRLTGAPTALYLLDIDGSHLLRLAGTEEFPERLDAPLALGPELAQDGIPDLRTRLEQELPGVAMAPMWLRGRAVGVLLALKGSEASLDELARQGAAAMELAGGYTDLFDSARRRKETTAAAELQQSLLPPRIARMGNGELAGSVFPSYEVGGDWFDYVENRDGAWLAIADAVGKGPTAGALGGIALAALRAARRSQQSLEEAAQTMHEVVCDIGDPEFFVTAIVARWHSVYSTFSWIRCGHPPPLVVRADNTIEQLATRASLPLGLFERERRFTRQQRRLQTGERLILHSDGITARRTKEGLFGVDGIERAVRQAETRTATALARAIQEEVMAASIEPLQDDAAVIVLAPETGQPEPSRGRDRAGGGRAGLRGGASSSTRSAPRRVPGSPVRA